MTLTAVPDAAEPVAPPRRFRLRWVTLAIVMVVVAAGVTTGVLWYRHYADAPLLENEGGEYGWLAADRLRSRYVDAGPFTADIAPIREGHRQGFVFWVYNPSSVTETIVRTPHYLADDAVVQVGTRNVRGLAYRGPYRAGPVDVPPHATRAVHFFVRLTQCYQRGGGIVWESVNLVVRTGGVTRTDDLTINNDFAYELEGTARACSS